MSDIYGKNYTKAYINNPAEQANMGEYGGVKKVLFDQVDTGAGADVLSIGKLPKGARVITIGNVGGNSPVCNVAPADLIAAEKIVTFTLGAAPTFPVSAWVEYVVD